MKTRRECRSAFKLIGQYVPGESDDADRKWWLVGILDTLAWMLDEDDNATEVQDLLDSLRESKRKKDQQN